MEGSSRKKNKNYVLNVFASMLSFSIWIQIVESSSPSLPSPISYPIIHREIDRNAETTSLVAEGNGNFYNVTVLDTDSGASHKLPPSLVNVSSLDPDRSVVQNSRLGLDIKEVVLTNLDLDISMMRSTIKSHSEYARDNDEYEFLSRYLLDDMSAEGKNHRLST